MEQRYRTTFINSLGGFKSVCLIGTVDSEGQTNLAIFNSLVHIGANPPYIGFIARPVVTERHTLENIVSTGKYTINQITPAFYLQAHQTSARYNKNNSEFEATGLLAEYLDGFEAPFVQEAHIKMAVEFTQQIEIAINNTSLIIGQIMQVYCPYDCIEPDGYVDLEKAGTVSCVGLDGYYTAQRLSRLAYAKAGKAPVDIPLP